MCGLIFVYNAVVKINELFKAFVYLYLLTCVKSSYHMNTTAFENQ